MWLIWFFAGMVFMFCISAVLVHKLLVRIKSNVGTPSASHNSASDKSLQYLEMAKGSVRGKGYITAIGYIDKAIANLRT